MLDLFAQPESIGDASFTAIGPRSGQSKDARLPVTVEDVRRAAVQIAGHVLRTPMSYSKTLSAIAGANVWIKFENMQFTASFKERGALFRLQELSIEERRVGVIAMSAGNHAQGVAYHAARLGIPSTIVMPENSPATKIRHTREHGAKVVIHGRTLEEAHAHAITLRDQFGLTFIHPFDDPFIIAGQGTIALEMLEAVPSLDCLIVPIGGGGLIAGMAVAAKAVKPEIQIVGIQTIACPGMKAALTGAPCNPNGSTIAEGIAVRKPGVVTTQIVSSLVDEILLVEESEIEEAIAMLIDVEKTVAEGAGAAGLAGLIAHSPRFAGKTVGLVICGGNIDQRLLASVLTRSLVRQKRLVKVRLIAEDRPGLLGLIGQVIGDCGANIIDVLHNRTSLHVPVKGAEFDITIESRDAEHTQEVLEALTSAGFIHLD